MALNSNELAAIIQDIDGGKRVLVIFEDNTGVHVKMVKSNREALIRFASDAHVTLSIQDLLGARVN